MFGNDATNRNCSNEESKSRLNSGSAADIRLRIRNGKAAIYRSVILPIVGFEYETWWLDLSKKT
jgi:hypothetical protein